MTAWVVIPAWNEARSIGPLLDELHALPAGTLDGVVVADGGSSDGTADVARRHGARVVNQTRRGYGAACHEGALAARQAGAEWTLFMDGDGSDPPAGVPALLESLRAGAADVTLGVRRSGPGRGHVIPWHARAGNRLVCALLRWRTGRWVSDLPSMKALSTPTLTALGMSEMGYGWTTELVAKALRRGLRVRETPLQVRPRTAGRSKVSGNVGSSARAAYALLRTAVTATR